MVIFDCNGVLVDSEPIATDVLAESLTRIGLPMTADLVAQHFTGRRPADIYAAVEVATGRKLPANFGHTVTAETLRRFQDELRVTPHIAYALTWVRGPKAVASSSTMDRICASLETADLLRFFESRLFSASEVPRGNRRLTFSCTRRRAWRSNRPTASWSRIRRQASRRQPRPA